MIKKGIDVSKWQGAIDWEAVASDGVTFAMVRVGYATTLGNAVDPYFTENIAGARAAGIDVGVYFYGKATSPEAARREAAFVVEQLEPYRGQLTYPVAYDAEDAAQAALSRTALTAVVRAFCDEVRAAGWYPMVYASRSWLETKFDPAAVHADVWLAQWASAVTYRGDYGIWQHSDTGAVAGITGNVDLDRATVDYPALLRREGWNGLAQRDPYADVPDWAREGVQWAVENGILRGSEAGLRVGEVCTRGELCVMMRRLWEMGR